MYQLLRSIRLLVPSFTIRTPVEEGLRQLLSAATTKHHRALGISASDTLTRPRIVSYATELTVGVKIYDYASFE